MRTSIFHLILILIVNIFSVQDSYAQNNTISAVFVFGDSTVDPGNNNYLPTIARGNFPPYGKDFANHEPTGRFSNGRLVPDFVAEFVGVKKNLPPYLDPSLTIEDLMSGVSFASAGAGFDPFTSQISMALTQSQQLDLFKEYKAKLEVAIGKERADDLVRRAGYLISSGTNDFTFNYYGPIQVRRKAYPTVSQYQQFQWQLVEQFLQSWLVWRHNWCQVTSGVMVSSENTGTSHELRIMHFKRNSLEIRIQGWRLPLRRPNLKVVF